MHEFYVICPHCHQHGPETYHPELAIDLALDQGWLPTDQLDQYVCPECSTY